MKVFMYILLSSYLVLSVKSTGGENEEVLQLENICWGANYLRINDTSIRPFRVHFDDAAINDLRYRLKNHRRVTPPLQGVGFSYGFNTDYLDYWVNYWADGYNFRAREAYLNRYPQFKTNIQGLDIHFLWVKPQVPPTVRVLPLLFLHGWPGTYRELYEAIPYLTAYDGRRNFAVEVIAPSLPGFAFSDAAVKPGLGAMEIAVVLRNLMRRLGFQKYYVQGGDWGSIIGDGMATYYPNEVLGYHTNFPFSRSPSAIAIYVGGQFDQSRVNPALRDRLYPISKVLGTLVAETGYFHIQATKPDTIGVAMSDSPAGMLAYLLQLFSSGTRKANSMSQDGRLEEFLDRDNLLDIMTIFWTTNSFTTSSRIYAESINLKSLTSRSATKPLPVPVWAVHAKDEIFCFSPAMIKSRYPNLLHYTILEQGGHFLAFERPKVFTDDILQAIASFEVFHQNQNNRFIL